MHFLYYQIISIFKTIRIRQNGLLLIKIQIEQNKVCVRFRFNMKTSYVLNNKQFDNQTGYGFIPAANQGLWIYKEVGDWGELN